MDKLEYIVNELRKCVKKKYESYVINAIYQKVNNSELEIVAQKSIRFKDSTRFIDFFLPQLKIAIEIDEAYHSSDMQKCADKSREFEINSALTENSLIDKIQFIRIITYGKTLDELNSSIDKVVNTIKEKIELLGSITWYYGIDVKRKYTEIGKITTEDFFSSNYEIINLLYNRNYKNWQRASYDNIIWFPVISYYDPKKKKETSRKGWVNYFSHSKDLIFEKSLDEILQRKKEIASKEDYINKKKRVTFVKEKDVYGKYRKRFAGVFIADGWDDVEKAERWRKISTSIAIPFNKNEL